MRLLVGDLTPDSGELVLRSGTRVSRLQQEIPGDLPGTASDVASEGIDYHLADAALTKMGIDPATEFAQMSAGGKRRVMLAKAFASEPDMLMLDEPTNHLDISSIAMLESMIARFTGTIVFVTHDQEEALTISDRIVVMKEGRLEQSGTPKELYSQPESCFVAEFIGENNKFLGQVADISGDKCKVKLEDGTEILANPVAVKAKGDKTKVSLRPERAIIDPSDKMDNNHKGKIEEIIYHGDHTRLRVDLLGNKDFILKVPNSTARLDLKKGNVLNIGWNSIDCRALDPK